MSFTALSRAHFLLGGGWRNNLLVAGAYVGLVIMAASVAYHNTAPQDHGSVSATFLGIISTVQAILLLLVAPSAVRKAVLRDFQTGMIESHRLTPLSGAGLISAYLTGPTAQALLLYATGLLLGGYFASAYGTSYGYVGIAIGGWYGSQLFLLPLTLLVIALSLLSALSSAGKANLTALLILFGIFGGWFIIKVVPGVALLTGVMSAGMLGQAIGMGKPINDPSILALGMLLQIAIAGTLLVAACRKVRAPEHSVFSVRLGLILLTLSGVTLAAGERLCGTSRWLFGDGPAPRWRWFASIITFLIVAVFPLLAAAGLRYRHDRTMGLTGTRQRRSALLSDALPLLVTLLTALLMAAMAPPSLWSLLRCNPLSTSGALLAAIALSCWIDYQFFYVAMARGVRLLWPVLLAWVVFKGVPLMLEGVAVFARETMSADVESNLLAGLSPLGTLLGVVVSAPKWVRLEPEYTGRAWFGLAAQLLLAIGMTMFARRERRKMQSTIIELSRHADQAAGQPLC